MGVVGMRQRLGGSIMQAVPVTDGTRLTSLGPYQRQDVDIGKHRLASLTPRISSYPAEANQSQRASCRPHRDLAMLIESAEAMEGAIDPR